MAYERNPDAGKFQLPKGYKDLGWQVTRANEQLNQCCEKGHNDRRNEKHWREFDNSLYKFRCTDVVTICDECKIVFHTDMSD